MIISRTPLRISFFGGGTDYPEFFAREHGAVLATAIDKFSYVTASPFHSHLFDYSIRCSYRKVELACSVHDIEHAVFRECLKLCGFSKDIEIHTVADLPAFTGLGSSSSFTVALLHALHSFKGEFLNPHELAYKAIFLERHILKDNVGCQDQTLAAFGGFNLIEFRTETDIVVNRVPLPIPTLAALEAHIVLVFTGITRKASEIVGEQLQHVEKNTQSLRALRSMAYRGYDILTGHNSLREFGELLHEAWQLKRSLAGVISNTEIDEIYYLGRKLGAWGGKLLGAGGGGFMLFLAPPETHHKLAEAFTDRQILKVKLNAPGSQIIYS